MSNHKISLVMDDETYNALRDYANQFHSGKISPAGVALLHSALGSAEEDALAKMVESAVERGFERMAKAASRGTKASLANLVLTSRFLLGLSNVASLNADMLACMQRDPARSEDKVIDALTWIGDTEHMRPEALFDWAWNAAGNISSAGTRPTYRTAVGDRGIR